MANVIVTLRIMPEGTEVSLDDLRAKATQAIADFGGEVGKHEVEPVAFGLKALKLYFVMPEEKGSTEPLEQVIAAFPGVNSVSVDDVRRAIG